MAPPPLRGGVRSLPAEGEVSSRWGSWSSAQHLVEHASAGPPERIDYVLLHELCHVRHPNHGKGFYELPESVSPSGELKKKLRRLSACVCCVRGRYLTKDAVALLCHTACREPPVEELIFVRHVAMVVESEILACLNFANLCFDFGEQKPDCISV